jgi:hypothetical protein
MTTTTYPNLYAEMKKAGWYRGFDTSEGGHYCVTVPGAPPLGGNSDGDLLYAGHFTKPDGTTCYQRSNMDRSVTTIVIDPMGNTLHDFKRATLFEAVNHLLTLNVL